MGAPAGVECGGSAHSKAGAPDAACQAGRCAGQLSTAAWVVCWICLSVSIIIVNKYVIGVSGFHFPISLAVWHMALGTVTARCAVAALRMQDNIREHASPALYGQLALIGVLFGGCLVTGNAALMFLSVPAVQMLKASGPATIYIMGIAMGNERLSLGHSLKVAVVCTGVGIASYGDVTLTAIGFFLQVASIMMDATRCCSLQRVLQTNHIEVGPLVTLAYVAPFALAALLLPAAAFEGRRLVSEYAAWRGAVPLVLLSGVLASALNLVVFKIIRLTSALTTSLTGVLKEWACILVAMYVYGTVVTSLQWLGYSIAICGLVWHQLGRIRAAQQKLARGRGAAADAKKSDRVVVVHASAGGGRLLLPGGSGGSRSGSEDGSGSGSGGSWDVEHSSNGSSSSIADTHSGASTPLLRVKM